MKKNKDDIFQLESLSLADYDKLMKSLNAELERLLAEIEADPYIQECLKFDDA